MASAESLGNAILGMHMKSEDDAGYKTEFWALKKSTKQKLKWTSSLLPPQTKICREDEEVNGRRKPRAADPREKMNEAAENTRSRGSGKLNLLGKIQKEGTNKELLGSALILQKLDSLRDVYCVSKTVDKDGWKILLNTMEEVICFLNSEIWGIGLSWSYHRKPDHVNRCTWADHALLQASMGSPQSSCEGLIWIECSNKVSGKQWNPRASPQCELQNCSQLKLQELHLCAIKMYWEQCLRLFKNILLSPSSQSHTQISPQFAF